MRFDLMFVFGIRGNQTILNYHTIYEARSKVGEG